MLFEIVLPGVLIILGVLSAFTLGSIVFNFLSRDSSKIFERVGIFISMIGSLAAVLAVILVHWDMELKNRPYVFAEPKIFSQSGNVFLSKTTIKNCGNTPAYNVVFETKLVVNGVEEKKPAPECERSSVYPNAELYHHFPIVFTPGDEIEYYVEIDYYDSTGNKFRYSAFYKFWEMGGGGYSWKPISTE